MADAMNSRRSLRLWSEGSQRNAEMLPELDRRKSALRLSIRYAYMLTSTHALGLFNAAVIVFPLRGHASGVAQAYLIPGNLKALVVIHGAATFCTALGAVMLIAPTLRWFAAGRKPDMKQQRMVARLFGYQSALLAASWGM